MCGIPILVAFEDVFNPLVFGGTTFEVGFSQYQYVWSLVVLYYVSNFFLVGVKSSDVVCEDGEGFLLDLLGEFML